MYYVLKLFDQEDIQGFNFTSVLNNLIKMKILATILSYTYEKWNMRQQRESCQILKYDVINWLFLDYTLTWRGGWISRSVIEALFILTLSFLGVCSFRLSEVTAALGVSCLLKRLGAGAGLSESSAEQKSHKYQMHATGEILNSTSVLSIIEISSNIRLSNLQQA